MQTPVHVSYTTTSGELELELHNNNIWTGRNVEVKGKDEQHDTRDVCCCCCCCRLPGWPFNIHIQQDAGWPEIFHPPCDRVLSLACSSISPEPARSIRIAQLQRDVRSPGERRAMSSHPAARSSPRVSHGNQQRSRRRRRRRLQSIGTLPDRIISPMRTFAGRPQVARTNWSACV